MSRLNPTTSACRMAASFRLRELGPRISAIGRQTIRRSLEKFDLAGATRTIVGFGVHRRPEEREASRALWEAGHGPLGLSAKVIGGFCSVAVSCAHLAEGPG